MNRTTLIARRLANLRLSHPEPASVVQVVAALGALQAQDAAGVLWAVGLRRPGSTLAEVEQAIARHELVRTWPMRGTLHLVPARDARWMLELMASRAAAGAMGRSRQLGLEEADFARCAGVLRRALRGGKQLTRDELRQALEAQGVDTEGQRGNHIIRRLGELGVLCFGVPRGKQPTFAGLHAWAPDPVHLEREEALAEIVWRYFSSHGPATIQDFTRWTGLTVADTRVGLAANAHRLVQDTVDDAPHWMAAGPAPRGRPAPRAHLLPGFDEYMLGFKDRRGALAPPHEQAICPGGNGMFLPTIVVDGVVVGTWKRTVRARAVDVALSPFAPLSRQQLVAVRDAAARYGAFIGLPARM